MDTVIFWLLVGPWPALATALVLAARAHLATALVLAARALVVTLPVSLLLPL